MLTYIKRSLFLISISLLITSGNAIAQQGQPQHGPRVLEGTEQEMLTADYWIAIQPDADKVIMTPDEIQIFNQKLRQKKPSFTQFYGRVNPLEPGFSIAEMLGTVFNPIQVFDLPATMPGDSLRAMLSRIADWLYPQEFYDDRRAPITSGYKDEVIKNTNMGGIGDVVVRKYGVIVNHTNVRVFPTPRPAWHDPTSTLDFFQSAGALVGEPVSIIHESVNKEYLYIESLRARGWVLSKDVAFASKGDAMNISSSKKFAIMTSHKVPVYSDPGFRNFSNYVYLSSRLPLKKITDKAWIVDLPYRKPDGKLATTDGYIKPNAGIHEGWVPYTKRNVLNIMFGLMELPYSWGDRDGLRACTGAVISVMRCFGFETGRKSSFVLMASDHIKLVNPKLTMAEKIQDVSNVEPIITIAGDWGHVVMFLGKAKNGKYYFIHQGGFGYRDSNGKQFIMGRQSVNSLEHPWYDINKAKVFTTYRK